MNDKLYKIILFHKAILTIGHIVCVTNFCLIIFCLLLYLYKLKENFAWFLNYSRNLLTLFAVLMYWMKDFFLN